MFALSGLATVSQFHMQKCARIVRGLSACEEFGMRLCEAHIGGSRARLTLRTGPVRFNSFSSRVLLCAWGG
jgi:hypothetical protein